MPWKTPDDASKSTMGRLFGDAEYMVVNVTRHVVPWVAAGGFGTVYPPSHRTAPIKAR